MKMTYTSFAIGVLYGFGLGVLLDNADLVNMTSLSLLVVFLILVPSAGWLEARNHSRRVENWEQIRKQGKFMFVITRYVLLRGGIMAAILMYALRGGIASELVQEITAPVLIVALGILGFQEWENCEKAVATPFGRLEDLKED